MSSARLVYIDGRHMTLTAPGTGVYHRLDRYRAEWPSYPEDPARPGFGKRTGREVQRTSCNRVIYRSGKDADRGIIHHMHGFRLDVARLFTRPCRQCSWSDEC